MADSDTVSLETKRSIQQAFLRDARSRARWFVAAAAGAVGLVAWAWVRQWDPETITFLGAIAAIAVGVLAIRFLEIRQLQKLGPEAWWAREQRKPARGQVPPWWWIWFFVMSGRHRDGGDSIPYLVIMCVLASLFLLEVPLVWRRFRAPLLAAGQFLQAGAVVLFGFINWKQPHLEGWTPAKAGVLVGMILGGEICRYLWRRANPKLVDQYLDLKRTAKFADYFRFGMAAR